MWEQGTQGAGQGALPAPLGLGENHLHVKHLFRQLKCAIPIKDVLHKHTTLFLHRPSLHASSCLAAVEVIEVNSYSSSVHVVEQLPGAAINAYASSCAFVNALALVEGRAGDVWDIKSWMGGDSERGIVPNARGYALLRKTSRSR